jgi:sarcosine oxidase subunit beta
VGRTKAGKRVRTTVTALVAILEYVSFPVLVDGYYDVTPDHHPVLGPLDAGGSLWVAAGLNGRGFMPWLGLE